MYKEVSPVASHFSSEKGKQFQRKQTTAENTKVNH